MIVKTYDGENFSLQRLSRKSRKSTMRAGHRIGVLPDGRELVDFSGEWYWPLRGATVENIKKIEELLGNIKY